MEERDRVGSSRVGRLCRGDSGNCISEASKLGCRLSKGKQAQPPWPLRFLDEVEPLLAVLGLSLPLLWLRGSYFKGHRIDHRVHKVISFA